MVVNTEKFPTLYSLSKAGKIKQWRVYAEGYEDGTASFTKVSGYIDGKQRESVQDILKGKNIGKSNETTPYEQACSDAKGAWDKKYKSGAVLDIDKVYNIVKNPMKAANKTSKYLDHVKNLTDAGIKMVYYQRKLNGMRCFAERVDNTTVRYTSIEGRELHTLDHLTPYMLKLCPVGGIFDGELYIHGIHLNKIISYTKKLRPETLQLQLRVYDYAVLDTIYEERKAILDEIVDKSTDIDWVSCPIVFEPTWKLTNFNDFKMLHDEFVKKGYEGGIIRLPGCVYEFNHRSNFVLKVKEFDDNEFEVVGGHEGTGEEAGCVIFDLLTNPTDEFPERMPFAARPEGEREERQEWMRNIDRFIGKRMTVRYFGLTEYGKPFHPVAVCVRDYD
jgi:DNA ligase-1